MKYFYTSPWTNGKPNHETGSGFGVRIPKAAYDTLFQKNWTEVVLRFEKEEVIIPITQSFWRKCHELRSQKIGKWLIKKECDKWPKDNPPEIIMTYEGSNIFSFQIR
jgi:hypothetical protein